MRYFASEIVELVDCFSIVINKFNFRTAESKLNEQVEMTQEKGKIKYKTALILLFTINT